MNPNANNLYSLSNDRESALWNDCIFVFDSSALLDFYFMPQKAREEVFKTVLQPKPDRFWIPAHVQYEFLKNREKVIGKPITEKYDPLQSVNLKEIEKAIKTLKTQTIDIRNKIKDEETHPHFEDVEVLQFEDLLKAWDEQTKLFVAAVTGRIDQAKKEISSLLTEDDVLAMFEATLKVGREFTFDEIYKITEEGAHRYDHTIPPGYEDQKDPGKKGTQIFGDLIIWKQILEYATDEKKNIVFICDDLKEDWCHTDKKSGGESRILAPREELVKELFDISGKMFWMYNLPQFLYHSKTFWGAVINEKAIQNVAEVITNRSENRPVIELDLIYTSGGRSPRGYSEKNPVEREPDGRLVTVIGAGVKPIIYWLVDWRYDLKIYNNSSFPAYNLKIESVGDIHFTSLEELRPVNNVPPNDFTFLRAVFEYQIEGVHDLPDELMKQRIPNLLNGLALKLTYVNENRAEFVSYMKLENGIVINTQML